MIVEFVYLIHSSTFSRSFLGICLGLYFRSKEVLGLGSIGYYMVKTGVRLLLSL